MYFKYLVNFIPFSLYRYFIINIKVCKFRIINLETSCLGDLYDYNRHSIPKLFLLKSVLNFRNQLMVWQTLNIIANKQ